MTYILSFVYLGIYWNNHHHMFQAVERVNGAILLANLNLLFWLSLIPFVTGWMGQNHFAPVPTAVYGTVLLLDSIAYFILERVIVKKHGPNSKLAMAVGNEVKGKMSSILYALAIPLAFFHEWMAQGIYVFVALMWLIPDRRIESNL